MSIRYIDANDLLWRITISTQDTINDMDCVYIDGIKPNNQHFNLEEHDKQIRAEAIEEVMKRAESIQLEQIENLNKSTRRNGKMWARYMSTYLGHIQVACKRMLELKEKNK